MASLFLASIFLALIIPPALSLTCTSQFSNKLYSNCLDLPSLSSYLHFSYNSTNATLSIAFVAAPPNSGGWVAWAINPDVAQMSGSQALVAYEGSDGVAVVKTYDVVSYKSIVPKKLSFDVWDLSAGKGTNGQLTIFAKIKVPADLSAKGTVNQVWQVGPGVSAGGMLNKHDFNPPNLAAKGSLDLNSGRSSGGDSSKTRKRNIHGILNAVSWGILLPVGVIIARYMRTFESADPAWFYLHAFCQVSAYAIGVAGWATGLKLGSESKEIVYSVHRNIGITLFSVATLQIFALFLRPKKDHKIRFYWNIYHHTLGYGIIVLGILNIFKGLNILNPAEGWKRAYIIVIAALGGIAVLLEAITWIVVLQRKSRKSTKPYDG